MVNSAMLTKAQRKMAEEMLLKGMTDGQIADRVGCSHMTINRMRLQKQTDEQFLQKQKSFDEQLIAEIEEIIPITNRILKRYAEQVESQESIKREEASTIQGIQSGLIDKRQIVKGKATNIFGGSVEIRRFEDL